jgi:hypothetical protein
MTTETETETETVRARPKHPELQKPEFAGVYWHHGGYHYRTRDAFPCIYFAKPESDDVDRFAFVETDHFKAKLALMKEVERKWLDHIEDRMTKMSRDWLEGKRL